MTTPSCCKESQSWPCSLLSLLLMPPYPGYGGACGPSGRVCGEPHPIDHIHVLMALVQVVDVGYRVGSGDINNDW